MEKEARIHRVSAADAPVAGGRTSRDRMLALVLASTLTGCAQGEEAGSAAPTGTEKALSTSTLDPGDCDGGDTAPLTVEELLEGMRAAGYDMYVDPGCRNADSAAWRSRPRRSTSTSSGRRRTFGRAQAREGAVSCQLYDGTDGEGATVRVHFEGEDWTTLSMLNVSCTIEPDPAKAQQQIDRLEQTLNELPAKSDYARLSKRAVTGVPSGGACCASVREGRGPAGFSARGAGSPPAVVPDRDPSPSI